MEFEEVAENSEEEGEYEPQITSADPAERKLARQIRIQRRIEAIKKQHEQEGVELVSVTEKSLVDKQTESSAFVLEQLLVEGEEVVTNVQIGNDTREVNRRAKEAAKRAEILEKIENESKQAEEMYEAITRKWDIIGKYKDPLDISDSISLQRESCNELIKQKDEIIAMLREEINQAEIKYVGDQEIQKEDILTLCRRIDTQVELMRKSYRHELQLIEDAVQAERQILIDANNKKWESLAKMRNADEETNMQKKLDMADEFLQVFYDTRVQHEEKFRRTKIALETEIEELQKELEQLKAACLLNGEKLDYNYNVLKKREDENLIIRSQQKRLINKLQDEINKVKRNMKKYKEQSEESISKLISEIKKTRNSIFQTEDKADHICTVNDKKYHEVWELNEEKARATLDKIKTTDRIIHEQLLGLEWKAPTKTFIKKTNLPSYKDAMDLLNVAKINPLDQRTKTPIIKLEDGNEIPPSLLKSILEKIAFRSGFLLENALTTILPELSENNKKLVRADNVFNAIGVTKPEHLKLIADIFLPYARCPVCEHVDKDSHEESKTNIAKVSSSSAGQQDNRVAKFKPAPTGGIAPASEQEEDFLQVVSQSAAAMQTIVISELDDNAPEESSFEETSASSITSSTSSHTSEGDQKSVSGLKLQMYQCKNNHPIYIENANVFKMLRLFVKVGYMQNEQPLSLSKRVHRRRNSLSRLLTTEDVKSFWDQFSSSFTKHHEDLWNGLLFGLKRYHSILEDRHKIYQEVISLRKENYDLRHMLKYCSLERKKKSARRKSAKSGHRKRSVSTSHL